MPEINLLFVDKVGNMLASSVMKMFTYLIEHVQANETSPLERTLSGVFKIYGRSNAEEVGQIELELKITFEPRSSQLFLKIAESQEIYGPDEIERILAAEESKRQFLGTGDDAQQQKQPQSSAQANSLVSAPKNNEYKPANYEESQNQPAQPINNQSNKPLVDKTAENKLKKPNAVTPARANDKSQNQNVQKTAQQRRNSQKSNASGQNVPTPTKKPTVTKDWAPISNHKPSQQRPAQPQQQQPIQNVPPPSASNPQQQPQQPQPQIQQVTENGLNERLDKLITLGHDFLQYVRDKDRISDQLKQLSQQPAPPQRQPASPQHITEPVQSNQEIGENEKLQAQRLNELFEEVKNLSVLRFRLIDFSCSVNDFVQRIKQRRICLDIQLPQLLSTGEEAAKVLFVRNIVANTLLFNEEVEFEVHIPKNNFHRLIEQNIKFRLYHTLENHVIEIASGSFSFMRLLTKGLEFQSLFKIHHYTRIPSTNTAVAATSNAAEQVNDTVKKVNVNRETLVNSQEQQYFGYLKVNITLASRIPDTLSSIGLPARKERSSAAFQTTPVQQKTAITNHPLQQNNNQNIVALVTDKLQQQNVVADIPFQMLLSLRKVRVLDKVLRNLFVHYKIYGTAESHKTEEVEHTYEGDFQHFFVFSVTKSAIQKMLRQLFILQLQERDEQQKRQLLGVTNYSFIF